MDEQRQFTMEQLTKLSTETLVNPSFPKYALLLSGLPITSKYDLLLSVLTGTVLDEPHNEGRVRGRVAADQLLKRLRSRPVKVVLYSSIEGSHKITTGYALLFFSPRISLEGIIERTAGYRIDRHNTVQVKLSQVCSTCQVELHKGDIRLSRTSVETSYDPNICIYCRENDE